MALGDHGARDRRRPGRSWPGRSSAITHAIALSYSSGPEGCVLANGQATDRCERRPAPGSVRASRGEPRRSSRGGRRGRSAASRERQQSQSSAPPHRKPCDRAGRGSGVGSLSTRTSAAASLPRCRKVVPVPARSDRHPQPLPLSANLGRGARRRASRRPAARTRQAVGEWPRCGRHRGVPRTRPAREPLPSRFG